jgi:hypothetical protein
VVTAKTAVKGTRRPLAVLKVGFLKWVQRLRITSFRGAPLTFALGIMTMALSTVGIAIALVALVIWAIYFGGKLPVPFGLRSCQGKSWREVKAPPE